MIETVTSRQNSLLTRIARLQNSKKFRREQGLFVGDGTKLLEEAIRWNPQGLRAVVLQEGIPCPELPDHVRAVQVPRALMENISQMEAPEGALFVSAVPEQKATEIRRGCLVLDGIQDPGSPICGPPSTITQRRFGPPWARFSAPPRAISAVRH